jgi:Leucine-rich repeat (LRR) protein
MTMGSSSPRSSTSSMCQTSPVGSAANNEFSTSSLRSSRLSQQQTAVRLSTLPSGPSGAVFTNHSVSADDRGRMESESDALKRNSKVNVRLDQCQAVRFPFQKRRLMLHKLNLTGADIPTPDLCGTALGDSLHELSLWGNRRLGSVPPLLVVSLPVLKTLDLSDCELYELPEHFDLPKLTRLNLSHNRFTGLPDEVRNVRVLFWLLY